MKTAVLFASTHGTSAKVADLVAQGIKTQDTFVFDLKTKPMIPMSDIDVFVIGGSIHAGSMQSEVVKFIKNNTEFLMKKKFFLFMISMNDKDYQMQLEKAFPALIREKALSIRGLGGEFIFEKMNFFQRWMVRKVSGHRQSVSSLKMDEINEFIAEINQQIP